MRGSNLRAARATRRNGAGPEHGEGEGPDGKHVEAAAKAFVDTRGAKFPGPLRGSLRTWTGWSRCIEFLAEVWAHLHATNLIKSTFATVRHRTNVTRVRVEDGRDRDGVQADRGSGTPVACRQRALPWSLWCVPVRRSTRQIHRTRGRGSSHPGAPIKTAHLLVLTIARRRGAPRR